MRAFATAAILSLLPSLSWAGNKLGMEDRIPARSDVDFVGKYEPNPIHPGKNKKGLKPADYGL